MAQLEFTLSADKLQRVSAFVALKAPLTIISQTPAPGAPIIEGMTVEVKAISLGDVPFRILDEAAPDFLRNVSVADMQKLIEDDDVVGNAARDGDIAEDKRAIFVSKLNSSLMGKGLTREITGVDATNVAKSLTSLGVRLR